MGKKRWKEFKTIWTPLIKPLSLIGAGLRCITALWSAFRAGWDSVVLADLMNLDVE